MPLPVDYDTVPVRGKYVYLDGTPASGRVTFTGKIIAISDTTDTIIVPTTISATLDSNGSFVVNLPATDDPDILPNAWTYTVKEELIAGGGRTYDIEVPLAANPSGIDLSEVAPVSPGSGDPTAFVTLATFESHTHEGSGGGPTDWSQITNKPVEFPPSAHTHAQSDVTGLGTALAGKADSTHAHIIGDVTGLQDALDGKQPAGSYANAVHSHTKADVGLALVDNTSDADKPVSTATQTALDGKLSLDRTLSVDPGDSGFPRLNITYAVVTASTDIEQVRVNGTNVSWRNEVGFLRGTPHPGHKDDAVVRGRARSDLSSHQGGYVELENSSSQKLHARRWTDGALIRGNGSGTVVCSDVLVLAASDPVPAGTPANTVIVRLS